MLPATARDVACRTIHGRPVSDCSLAEIPIEDLDALGFSYEAQQPPIYYAVTALLRQPISLVVNGFVNSARLTGAIWLAGGLALLWWFLRRRLGATALATATACILVSMAPMVVGQSYTVNNDAAAVLIGATTLVGYERLRRDAVGIRGRAGGRRLGRARPRQAACDPPHRRGRRRAPARRASRGGRGSGPSSC